MWRWLMVLSITLGLSWGQYRVEPATQPFEHSECPSWDSRKNLLFFVDIHQGSIVTYNPENQETNLIKVDGSVAPVLQTTDPNVLIIGLNRSIGVVVWDGVRDNSSIKPTDILATVGDDFPTSRMNDGKVDVQGRVWIGTMGNEVDGVVDPNAGALYRIDKANATNPILQIQPVNISNGMAWNRNNTKFYYIDSKTFQVSEFDYNATEGTISNRRVAYDLAANGFQGDPDGMTIDKDDNLWVAVYSGGVVLHINPSNNTLLQTINIPATQVTSTMWGGRNLDTLYVTTSRIGLTEEQLKEQPQAGAVFAITNLGTSGLPIQYANILTV